MSHAGGKVLIIADIEGSSGCWSYRASQFLNAEWARACACMSRDVDVVVRALFEEGAVSVTVKDFHRTGYNIIPGMVDRRARVVHGYHRGPVPGIGDPGGATVLLMMGMHAASGSNGFLAHTLTSRISRLEVGGRLLSEAELFASSLAGRGIRPIFFSGCPVACRQATDAIPGIHTFAIDKSGGPETFDAEGWRTRLARAAAEALRASTARPYRPAGPTDARVTMRDGEAAALKLARRWGLLRRGDTVIVPAADIDGLYRSLIRLCYLAPATERIVPAALAMYGIIGRAGLYWASRTVPGWPNFNN